MTTLSLEEKKQQILEYEESLAHTLARQVVDKPVPPIWMILIPIFFVFHASKIKEYSEGLKAFADHYLISRRRALDTAYKSVLHEAEPEIDPLMKQAEAIPEKARSLYQQWITLLIDHYRNVLVAPGATAQDRIRSHYRNKSNYLLFSNQFDTAENAFNKALLPEIDGEQEDILYIADKLQQSSVELHRKEVENIYS